MAINREDKIIRTSIIGIIGNISLVAIKAIIGLFTNSVSIILDAVNNLSDALSSIITIIGTKLSTKKPDREHPYGHGRIEYVTALIIAAIILVAGGSAIYESINALINNKEATYSNISLIIIAIAIVIKITLGLYFRYMGKKTNSTALKGSGIDALFDAVLSTATLIGAIVAMFTGVYIEGYLGIVIGLFIIRSGIEILRDAISNIIGQRASEAIVTKIKKVVLEFPGVLGAYDLILNNYGPNRSIGSIHIEVDGDMKASDIHVLTRNISIKIYQEFGIILTVGIYSANQINSTIRKFVFSIVKEIPEVREVHGLFVDEELKLISFDLIIDFKCKKQEQLIQEIKEKVEKEFPDYKCQIVQDFDFSD